MKAKQKQCQLCKKLTWPIIPHSWSGLVWKRISSMDVWSLWGSQQPSSCVLGHFRHSNKQPTNQVILVQACSLPARGQSFAYQFFWGVFIALHCGIPWTPMHWCSRDAAQGCVDVIGWRKEHPWWVASVCTAWNCVRCVQLCTTVFTVCNSTHMCKFAPFGSYSRSYFCGPILVKNFSFPWSHFPCVTYTLQSLKMLHVNNRQSEPNANNVLGVLWMFRNC